MKKHWTCILLATMAAALIAPPHVDAAATKPDVSQSDKDGAEQIHQAVITLQKEYQAFETDPTATIQTDSNYFKKNKAPNVTQALIIKALSVNYGNDPQTDAYVKWQLLSAVPGKFDKDLVPQAEAVYERAAAGTLFNHPGLDHRPLDQAIAHLNGNSGEAAAAQLTDQMTTAMEKNTKLNRPMLEYRNRLFSALTPTEQVCSAGLQDLAARMNHGLPSNDIFEKVRSAIIEWGIDASVPQMQVMSNTLKKMAAMAKNPAIVAYTNVAKDATGNSYHWGGGAVIGPNDFNAIVTILEKDAANPPDQLGFKKEDK